MSRDPRHSAVLKDLRERLRQIDRSRAPAAGDGALSSTGVAALDALLPATAFRAGMIVEWVVEGAGSGAVRLALPMVIEALQNGGVLVVIDDRREFYPPAALRLGLDLDRMIVVRPRNRQETIWTFEQALRCLGVAVTLGWINTLPDRVFRRLQLAAEHGAGLGLFMRPAEARREPTWADIRWAVQSLPGNVDGLRHREKASPMQAGFVRPVPEEFPVSISSGRRLRVELLHCRGGTGGRALQLEISDETGAVLMVPPLAAPASVPRAARA
jgi:hypothetical protein